jgi:hypothetical protein
MATAGRASTRAEHRLFLWAAILIALVTFAGFARTYFLRGAFHSPELSVFLHAHGAVMTSWIVLYLVQAILVTRRRVGLHRRLGYLGAGVAVLVVVMGCAATILAAARELRLHSQLVNLQLSILGLELAQMALFGGFVATAIMLRSRTDMHKRLMLLATLCMMPNPEIRIAPFLTSNLGVVVFWGVQVVLVVLLDAVLNRRLHRAFAGCALAAIAVLYAVSYGANTAAWRQFAGHILG